MLIQHVYVSWLKNPSSMPAGLKRQLDAAGLKQYDYSQILALNPFANGAGPNRPKPLLAVEAELPIRAATHRRFRSSSDRDLRSTEFGNKDKHPQRTNGVRCQRERLSGFENSAEREREGDAELYVDK